jgi:predicted ATPase
MFTDIEGSTRLHRALADDFRALNVQHDDLLGNAIAAEGGIVVKSLGDGLFAVFADAGAAVRAAGAIQRTVSKRAWPGQATVRVRIGLHTGPAEPQGGDYVAIAVHQASRVTSAAWGRQIVASGATVAAAGPMDKVGSWRVVGAYRLKDFDEPVDLACFDPIGLSPGPETVRATPVVAHNVPDIRSAFIGRKNELAELSNLLAQGRRLITVLGPGGVGKTRVAFELTKLLASRFDHGAWLVLLANADRSGEIETRVLQGLGVPDRAGVTLRRVLIDSLKERHCLLVMDNCEHVNNQVADVVQDVLANCPEVSVVATSREPLRLVNELEWRLAPLPVADGVDDAVELFISRAVSRFPKLVLDPELVVRVCKQIDGLPLAVELAAGRLGHMTLAELLGGLQDQMRLLTSSDRELHPRQRSLNSMVGWSYELLEEPAQQLFAQLSVLRAAARAEAVRAVAGDMDDSMLDEALADLVNKSLVDFDPENPRPYRMLVTIRDFARLRLDQGGRSSLPRRRHAEWFSGVAQRIDEGLDGPEAIRWLEEGDTAHDDLSEAMRFASEVRDAELLASVANPLSRYFILRGRLTEGGSGSISWRASHHLAEAERWLSPPLARSPACRQTRSGLGKCAIGP